MCTLFIAIDSHPDFPLIVAANRDEFYNRKTAPLQDWGEIVGGRDLRQGGHWFAADKRGRWAALTNYRDPTQKLENPHTRGDLVKDYLQAAVSIEKYVGCIENGGREYEGFNLLLGDSQGRVGYYSNVTRQLRFLDAGIYGLSNALLNTPWPKVTQGKKIFLELLSNNGNELQAGMLTMLQNNQQANKCDLPDTGIPVLMEQLLSSLFIKGAAYGTRSSALLLKEKTGDMRFVEQGYAILGRKRGLVEVSIKPSVHQ